MLIAVEESKMPHPRAEVFLQMDRQNEKCTSDRLPARANFLPSTLACGVISRVEKQLKFFLLPDKILLLFTRQNQI